MGSVTKNDTISKRTLAPQTKWTVFSPGCSHLVSPVGFGHRLAEIIRPRRRRRLSEEQRQEAAERLREYQPAKGQSVLELVRQRAEEALESPFANPVV